MQWLLSLLCRMPENHNNNLDIPSAALSNFVLVSSVGGILNDRADIPIARIDQSCYRFEIGLGIEDKRVTVVR